MSKSEQPEGALVLQGAGARGQSLTLLLGGSTVLSLKRRARILELLSFVVRREKYK